MLIKKDKWSDEELLTQLKGEVSNDTSDSSVPVTPKTN